MAQNGGGKGWQTDPDTGEKVMLKTWVSLLDWLLQGPDRDPKTQYEWAELNGMHEDSVRRIKRDQRFAKEWDRRAAELNIHPERTQSVIYSLHAQAVGGSVQAASLYLQYVEKFTPKRRVVVDDDRDAAGLSNDELADELEAQVSHLRVVENNGS
jgi:ribosome-binding protein aMBF1 (putative translation factor)